ncbi:MAG: hypothetical protein ABSB31_08500 [Dehalococcoidia bacterium]|jgi:hypothetical protein
MPNNPVGCPVVHKQVPAKVTAYVDEGIKELVELLNSIPGLCTFESCEGSSNHWATVEMDYGIDYTNGDKVDLLTITQFADNLWDYVKEREIDICDSISISLEWHPRRYPFLVLRIDHRYISNFVNILLPLCNEHIHHILRWNHRNG